MEPVLNRLTAFLFVLSLAGSAFAGEDTKPASDPLETARRDIESLSSVNQNGVTKGQLPEASVPIPTFSQSTSGVKPAEADSRATVSQGWLLDALRNMDAQGQQKGFRDATKSPSNEPKNPRQGDEAAANPLHSYLDQWLSPQDKKLLLGTMKGSSAVDRNQQPRAETFRGDRSDSEFSLTSMDKPRERSVGLAPKRENPYLLFGDEDQRSSFSTPVTPAPGLQRPTSNSTLPVMKEGSYPLIHDAAPALDNRKSEDLLPVPTAPLIDERRYFPQLRRF